MKTEETIIQPDDLILVTGAPGFIGPNVVRSLLDLGFRNIRCFVRASSDLTKLKKVVEPFAPEARIDYCRGNLLSRDDCARASEGVRVVYHLAAGRGAKMHADAFMNSVVVTRNLLESLVAAGGLKRFVTVSSFSVYTNRDKPHGRLLDETCPMEQDPGRRGDAYSFSKVRQDELVMRFGEEHAVPYVIVRPGAVYGPGNEAITGRVGIGTFGMFLHLGGGNPIPLTYVENCADAIALAGVRPGVDGEVFNLVDDELPSSRSFLRQYKRRVGQFRSLYLPKALSYLFCMGWEKYSRWSQGQLPPSFNRASWHAYWKRSRYSNEKAKDLLGWTPRVAPNEAMDRYFASCKAKKAQ